MAKNDLKINIIAQLNTGLSINQINTAISGIEKKVKHLKLKIDIEDRVLNALKSFAQQMQKVNVNIVTQTIQNFDKQKNVAQKMLQDLAKTGKYTTSELQKIGTSIHLSTTIQELDKLKVKMQNMKFGTGFKEQQEQLRIALEKLNNQGIIVDRTFRQFNTSINGAKNVAELNRVKEAINRTADTSKNIQSIKKFQQEAQIAFEKLSHIKTINKTELNNWLNATKGLDQFKNRIPEATQEMSKLKSQMKQFQGEASNASQHTHTFGGMLQQAFTKFPIWMIASTAFFGSFRALTGTLQIITDVDSRLTSLKKVMDSDTNFTEIMDNATLSAQRFGKTLNEVLDAYTEFARQGYKQQDLVNLGDAGLITSNVGEMTSARAAEYLTSALVQMNMETKDSMKIIDAWNNVSNKNATTVEKLAAGMSKAGSTAHAFGLDMNQLNAIVGTVNFVAA